MIVKLYRSHLSAQPPKDAITSASTWTGRSSGGARETRATWAARFLNVGEHRGFVGGWLRRKLFDSEWRALKVFSGHDYSILSLLAALGLLIIQNPTGLRRVCCRRAPSVRVCGCEAEPRAVSGREEPRLRFC